MSYVTKMTGYGAVLLASLAIAMALLMSSPVEETEAANGTVAILNATLPASQTNVIGVGDIDLTAAGGTGFAIFTLAAGSEGLATFPASGGSSLLCINDTSCDTNDPAFIGTTTGPLGLLDDNTTNPVPNLTVTPVASNTITVDVMANAPGNVAVDVRVADGGDGIDASSPTSSDETDVVLWSQTAAIGQLRLFASVGTGATDITTTGGSIPATPTGLNTADQVLFIATFVTASGGPAVIPAGTPITFSAGSSGTGIFFDSQTDQLAAPASWIAAMNIPAPGLGLVAPVLYGTAATGESGCTNNVENTAPGVTPIPPGDGEGRQSCSALTEFLDDLEGGTIEPIGSSSAAVVFEGAGIPGDANIVATGGGLTSNSIAVTLFGPPRDVEIDIAPAAAGGARRISNLGTTTTVLTLTVTDALGFPVSGATPTFETDPAVPAADAVVLAGFPTGPSAASCSVATGATGRCDIIATVPGPATDRVTEGDQTINVGLDAPPISPVLDSETIQLVGPPANITFVSQDPEGTVDALSTFTVTFQCTTLGGFDCLAGTVLPGGVTGAGLLPLGFPAVGAQGQLAVTVIAEDQKGNSIAVVVGPLAGQVIQHNVMITPEIEVGNPGGGTGVFAPPVAPQGQTFTTFSGGSVQALLSALQASGATSATATLPDGSTVTAIVTTLTFVNADFSAAFPTIPAGQIFAVRSLN